MKLAGKKCEEILAKLAVKQLLTKQLLVELNSTSISQSAKVKVEVEVEVEVG